MTTIKITAALIILALSLPVTAFAQTPVTNQQAQQYYQNCMTASKSSTVMQPKTQEILCQCAALHMQKHITIEDIAASTKNDQAARNALNKIVTMVYAPCMEYPVRDLIASSCAQKINNAKICNCVSDKMAAYTAREAQTQLPDILAVNPNATDPTAAFMESSSFKQTEQQIALTCAQQK